MAVVLILYGLSVAFSSFSIVSSLKNTDKKIKKDGYELIKEEKYFDALERIVEGLRELKEFSDYDNIEFRALLMALIFNLAEIYFELKDYKQSEKELKTLFKILESMMKVDLERFGKYHILAMELSTRILRSKRKTLDLLVRQQMATGALFEKVNAGVAAATDRLVDSLCKTAQLLASTGDYRDAIKFYAEAIKFSKKRSGRVTRKEVKITIEMAEIMMRLKQTRPKARRLLDAILPHSIELEAIELQEKILTLIEILEHRGEDESKWKSFMQKITILPKLKEVIGRDSKKEDNKKKEEKK